MCVVQILVCGGKETRPRREIQCFIDGLPELRQAVREHWPSEEERQESMRKLTETPPATRPMVASRGRA